MRKDAVVCLSAVSKTKDAERIAHFLVSEKYAACVTILPQATSVYSWKNKIHREKEYVLLMKTTPKRLSALKKALLKIHPYECPEFLALSASAGHTPYLRWLFEGTTP